MRVWGIFLVFVLSTSLSYAYIDPGTGGYLLQSLWGWLVGIFTIVVATVGHFFRHTLRLWFLTLWKNYRIFTLLGILIVAALLVYLIMSLAAPSTSGEGGLISIAPSQVNTRTTLDDFPDGVQVYNDELSFGGYTLMNGVLIDMEGNEVHEWSNGYLGVIDENGDYYGQKCLDCPEWGRYTWNDEVIWEKIQPIHHEILLTPWNTVVTMVKEVKEYKGRQVEFDVIVEFAKNGSQLWRWSTWDNFEYIKTFHSALTLDLPPIPGVDDGYFNTSIWGGNYDYYHLNSMSLIPQNDKVGTHPAFTPGNWLISFRHGSMLFLLDNDTSEIYWRALANQIGDGALEGQHGPFMLEDGSILVFDNGRYRDWSRVIIIDPVTLDVIWEYKAPDFYTHTQGFAQPLDNGNILVTQSEAGRGFEITRDKEIVWDFYIPYHWPDNYTKAPGKAGTRMDVYRMIRYDKEFIEQFLDT